MKQTVVKNIVKKKCYFTITIILVSNDNIIQLILLFTWRMTVCYKTKLSWLQFSQCDTSPHSVFTTYNIEIVLIQVLKTEGLVCFVFFFCLGGEAGQTSVTPVHDFGHSFSFLHVKVTMTTHWSPNCSRGASIREETVWVTLNICQICHINVVLSVGRMSAVRLDFSKDYDIYCVMSVGHAI